VQRGSNEERVQLARGEFADADLGDKRLDKRLLKVITAFASHPNLSIPAASPDWAAAKGTYRLFGHESVTPEKLLASHRLQTIERCLKLLTILVIGDTTKIDFSRRKQMSGLGPLSGEKGRAGAGLFIHSSLASTESGVPLGVLANDAWARDLDQHGKAQERCKELPIEKKESRKWLGTLEEGSKLKEALPDAQVIAVFDREGDIYAVFHDAVHVHGIDFVIRALHNRKVVEDDESHRLWDFVKEHELGELTITIPRRHGHRKREARLSVRAKSVAINAPPKPPKGETRKAPVPLTALWVEEIAPGRKEPISWKLVTSLPIETPEDARRVLRIYTRRWLIETYFRTLKTGCKVEQRAFESADRFLNCFALDAVVAWTILYLTTVARERPDLPCTVLFSDPEWKAAWAYANRSRAPPETPPTLGEMTLLIGKLGGHLGRKSDGFPGAETLWRGLQVVATILPFWMMLSENP
jgi:hypothetical protein